MTAYARREITGGAVATTLSSGIASGDPAFTIVTTTGWPTGGVGDFFVVIDRGTANEEKVLCASRSGASVTVQTAGRGVDGTSAVAHSAGAAVEHCLFARDADEANLTVSKTVSKATAAGQILVVDAANSFAAVQGKTSGQLLMGNGTTVVSNPVSGDVTIDGTGATTIGATKVTYAKMQNVSASPRILGRTTAGAGSPEEISVDASLGLAANNLQRAALTGDVTASAGSNATAIAANAVTLAKLATQADQTILGNRSGGVAVPSAMTAAQTMTMLSGTAVGDFAMNTHKITGVTDPGAAQDAATKNYVDLRAPSASSTWVITLRSAGGAVAVTINYAHYVRVGPLVTANFYITLTANGAAAGNQIDVGLPVNHVFANDVVIGGIRWSDGTSSTRIGGLYAAGSDATRAVYDGSTLLGTPALAIGNSLSGTMSYMVA